MTRFVRVAVAVLALPGVVRAGGTCNASQAVQYGGYGYTQSYAQPYYQQYYTPVIKELQYVVTAPAYGNDYGAGTQYGAEQLRAKIEREVREKIESENLKRDLAEVKALLQQRPQAPVQAQPATWTGPAPVQQLGTWPGPAPVQQLQLPQKTSPAPSSQGWPSSQGPGFPAPQPPVVAPAPGGSAAVVPPEAQTLQVLEAKCAKCHNPQTARGNFVLFAGPGTLSSTLTPGDVVAVEQKVGDGDMPPPETGVSVSNEEFTGIKAWRQANAGSIQALLGRRR
jgi:hypothetical protein